MTVVVFDLDGTLIDSTNALLATHEHAFRSVNLKCPDACDILKLVGLPLTETMRRLAPQSFCTDLVSAYSDVYPQMAAQHERLFDGVVDVLALPFRAAVATGKSQKGAERAVTQHGLATRFELVLGADSVRRPKPYPDLLMKVMRSMQTDDLIMVGDTTYDLEMARAAGVRAIGVDWGHHPRSELETLAPVVASFAELREILEAYQ